MSFHFNGKQFFLLSYKNQRNDRQFNERHGNNATGGNYARKTGVSDRQQFNANYDNYSNNAGGALPETDNSIGIIKNKFSNLPLDVDDNTP